MISFIRQSTTTASASVSVKLKLLIPFYGSRNSLGGNGLEGARGDAANENSSVPNLGERGNVIQKLEMGQKFSSQKQD